MIPHRTLAGDFTIPHRFIRCIPTDPSDEAEAWWHRFGELHPGWDMRTIQDPIDPKDWPLLGRWHALVSSGAQLAGLVRLEAVWRWGGWYVDSDVEPLRPFADLDSGPGVAVIGTEDGIHLTDAVFGAPQRHPAIRAVIEHVDDLYTGWARCTFDGSAPPGAQATGPLATTTVLAGRPDVTVLPTEAFYPYSYTERHRRLEDFATTSPTSYAVHHWAFSWAGT